jgi:hypothetical protein
MEDRGDTKYNEPCNFHLFCPYHKEVIQTFLYNHNCLNLSALGPSLLLEREIIVDQDGKLITYRQMDSWCYEIPLAIKTIVRGEEFRFKSCLC